MNFIPLKYLFTVDYAESEIADDPAQHKQSHVLQLLDAKEYTGNIVALPNNRVRVTHPAWFQTGEGSQILNHLIMFIIQSLIWIMYWM